MYATVPTRKSAWRRRRGMGDVCSVDRYGNRVCGPSVPGMSVVGPPIDVFAVPVNTGWLRTNPMPYPGVPVLKLPPVSVNVPPWGGWNSGTTSNLNSIQIASLIQIYNSNPAALTPQQWAQLQQAGVIPQGSVYGSSSSAPPVTSLTANDPQCVAVGQTGGPYPNCTPVTSSVAAPAATDFLSTDYGPLTGIEWIGLGIGAYFLFFRKK
jgi:hypothetical protein